MFRKKFYLTLNLLLGGSFLITQGLTSCDAAKEQFSIFLTQNYDGGGIVTSSKTQGLVGETIKIEVELNDGYTVAHIKVNGEIKSEGVTSFEFQPVAGENKVEVVFADENGTIIDPGAKPIKGQFQFKIILNGNHGKVEADKIKGKVGENVTVTITPDPGYEIEAIEFNKEQYGLEARTFTPVEGKNTLKVSFAKIKEVHNDWTLEVTTTEGGSVTPSAIEGKKGDKVEIEVTLEPEFVLDKITFNGKETSKDTRVFEPVEGVNKLEVSFVHESTLSKLDKGFKLTGTFKKEHETDIKTPEEFLECLNSSKEVNSWFFNKGTWEYLIENVPEFMTIPEFTGITKDELINDVKIAFCPTLKKLMENQFDFTNVKDVAEVITYFKNVYDNLSMAEWYAFACIFHLGQMGGGVEMNYQCGIEGSVYKPFFTDFMKDELLGKFGGVTEIKDYINSFEKETILEIHDDSFLSEETKKNFLFLTEFGYKIAGKLFAITRDVNEIAKTCVTLFKFINSGNLEGIEKDFVEAANLIGTLITDGFCDKDSFPLFMKAFVFIQDMMNQHFSKGNYYGFYPDWNLGVELPDYRKLLPEALRDIHHLYRVIKFIGFIAKDATINELEFIKVLMKTGNVKYGESFVHASKAFMRAYTGLGNEALLVKEAFPLAVQKLDYLSKTLFNAVEYINDDNSIRIEASCTNASNLGLDGIKNNLDLEKVLTEIDNASKKDVNALTEEDELYYQNFVETEMLQKVTFNQKAEAYKFTGKTNYEIGESLDLSITKFENGQEVEKIKLTNKDVTGFDTSKRRNGHLFYKVDELRTVSIRYKVGNSLGQGKLLYGDKEWINPDETLFVPTDADLSKFRIDFDREFFTDFEIIGLDLTKTGEQFIALKINEEYLFGRLYVYDPKDCYEFKTFSSFEKTPLPLNEEIDFSDNRFNSISTFKCLDVDGERIIMERISDEKIDSVSDVNGTGQTKIAFDKEGTNKFLITAFSSKLGNEETFELSIDVKKPLTKEVQIRANHGYNFYNFLGATRLENEVLDFYKTTYYNFDSVGYTMGGEILKLTANDFDNKLDATKSLSGNNTYVVDYYQGYKFEYPVFGLVKEILNGNFIGDSYAEFSFLKDHVYGDQFNIQNGNYYLYNYLYDSSNSKPQSSLIVKGNYNLEKKITLDTSKVGEHSIDVEVIDGDTPKTIKALYNVVEPLEIRDEFIWLHDNIKVSESYTDDHIFIASNNFNVLAYGPYSQREIYLSFNGKTMLKFGDIKGYIDFSWTPGVEQRIDYVHNGRKVILVVYLSE